MELYASLSRGESLRSLAKRLNRSHTSLSRELARHSKYDRTYKPVLAHAQAVRWATKQRSKAPLKTSDTFVYVMAKLKLGWSPQTISGRIGIDQPGLSVSHEAIYRWIYSKKWRRDRLWQYLECGHHKRRHRWGCKGATYAKVLSTKSINLRPKTINRRSQVGHWETDLMESSREVPAALSVSVERVTRLTKLTKVANKTAKHKTLSLTKQLTALSSVLRQTITADRGKENSNYMHWENQLGVTVYFCQAYHSWEKGTVENTIKRIRRFIPKGENLTNYSWREIKYIEDWINNKPMKCLQYLTPYEKMQSVTQGLESKT